MFKNVNELLESAFAMHHEQEERLSVENHERPRPELSDAVQRARERREREERQREEDEDSQMETNNTTTASEESHDEGTITVTVRIFISCYRFIIPLTAMTITGRGSCHSLGRQKARLILGPNVCFFGGFKAIIKEEFYLPIIFLFAHSLFVSEFLKRCIQACCSSHNLKPYSYILFYIIIIIL